VSALTYRLLRTPPERSSPPLLDAHQRAVVEHPGGPLLVLAGPGTGKTTTLVEAVAHRVAAGVPPESVLVLTFSRKAAAELRDRIAARLGRGVAMPLATTFHSFCYALLRAHQPADLFSFPLRLLSGPEQDVLLRELVAGSVADGAAGWPPELRACLTTRGFADELRAVLARARELGLDPTELAAHARGAGRQDWSAAAAFLGEYLDVLDARGVLDYAELVHRAVLLAESEPVGSRLRARYATVFVDEYQDTDPAQVRLLRALAGGGRDLVVVGDPDQSIYAFRGADVGGILNFPVDFPCLGGAPAPVRVLRVSRRAGPALLAASRELARRMPLARLPADRVREHRDLRPADPAGAEPASDAPSAVRVLTVPTPAAELDTITDLLRRAHLTENVPWGQMAVLVRSGARSVPVLRRVLTAAGIPVEVAGDERPLGAQPAVSTLLTALRCAAEPEALTVDRARALLLSPLGGADATELRLLGRALRAEERQAAAEAADGVAPRASAELIREALAEPERLVALPAELAAGAAQLGRLLLTVRQVLAEGGSPHEALWALWSGSPRWVERLRLAAYHGGPAGRAADQDLDAVCALFDAADRAADRAGHKGVRDFLAELAEQEIAGDTLTERAPRGDAVRVLTAHRSKGLQWRLVVVAGVQEGLWPDLRRRGSLLDADRIGPDGLVDPLTPAALLAEERRLFYVAVTRASEKLVVTAVRSPADDGDQPSRFLEELGVPVRQVTERPPRPLAVPALVAQARAMLVDPTVSEPLRQAAARRLAMLAARRDGDGRPLVPSAHPSRWWGLYEQTASAVPVRDPAVPVKLSGSALTGLVECPLRWFLDREVHAQSPATGALGFGSVIHALADDVASDRTPASLPVLMDRLDRVWDALAFDAPWQSDQQREAARAALERFLTWHVTDRGRALVATEQEFTVRLRAGEFAVEIRGSMDRVEQDQDGLAYVVDFKTGKTKETREKVAFHPQLAVYQLAVNHGALADTPAFRGRRARAGGAELVQLRLGEKEPVVQRQAALDAGEDGTWIERLLAEAAGRVLSERFTATACGRCATCDFRRCCPAWPEGGGVVE
jgi:superfamily I DNA/RNA helicase/RecB family exonuclease